MRDWTPGSWRSKPAAQQPTYVDESALDAVVARVHGHPPLVSLGEIELLTAQLAEAAKGQRFVLQGGDCAEQFEHCTGPAILSKLKILLQMSLVLTYGARRPVVRVGRIAGQYAKPRSQDLETVDGRSLSVYRGDNVNALRADPEARRPDPARLEQGYFHAAATLNFVRALLDGGFANLRAPEHWQLDFIAENSPGSAAYRDIAERIGDAIDYLESLGGANETMRRVDFFVSHEALLLPYEQAMTRRARSGEQHHNLGAHFLWLGDRTRQVGGAHVEYLRGIQNPIGVKVGPRMTADELLELVALLDPERRPGRLTLITRLGAEGIEHRLPPLLRAVRSEGSPALWLCDPMHGNTTMTAGGYKTRHFASIVTELTRAFELHEAEGSVLGGVHFELTGENVTECTGGPEALASADLERRYVTGCDPRLNYAQSMEIAFRISALLGSGPRKIPPSPW